MMRKFLKTNLVMALLIKTSSPLNIVNGQENQATSEAEVIQEEGFSTDGHHTDHHIKANFIPQNILNPDDSLYQAPKDIDKYVGVYSGQTEVPGMDTQVHILLAIEEDGIFNLSYYFNNPEDKKGLRFYVDEQGKMVTREAIYQDLIMMTGALMEAEGGLTSGLIRKTISPVVLLDNNGEGAAFYPYHNMAYDLRDNYQNARVYQNVGLYVVDDEVVVDVNHLIGLESEDSHRIALEKSTGEIADQFLVEKRTYELLQESFDTYLNDYNDFDLTFESENDFVQVIQAMHLKTNASFPKETTFELLNPESVNKEKVGEEAYALLINDSILYFYDGVKLFISDDFTQEDDHYIAKRWKTN